MNVRMWYRYGAFIRKRYRNIYNECIRRGFDVQDNFNDVWIYKGDAYNLDYEPTENEIKISKDRIKIRIKEKPDFYRYQGKTINIKDYIWAITVEKEKFITTK